MTQPISSYIEAMTNPTGRFKTLQRVVTKMDRDNNVLFYRTMFSVTFECNINGVDYRLKCLNESAPERLRDLRVPYGLPFVGWSYLAQEMLVEDIAGQWRYVDIILEEIPLGEKLNVVLQKSSKSQIGLLLNNLFDVASVMAREQFAHRNLKASNIIVRGDYSIALINYDAAWHNIDDDNIALASIAMALYLYRVDERLVSKNLLLRPNLVEALMKIEENLPLKDVILSAKGVQRSRAQILEGIEALIHRPDFICDGGVDLYDETLPEGDGLTPVMRDMKWDYVDANHKTLFGGFDYVESFSNGRAVVALEDGFGLIDLDGRPVITALYEEVRWYPCGNVAVVTDFGKSFICSSQGVPLSDCRYDWIGDFEEGLFAVGLDDKYGYVDAAANVVIPIFFDNAYDFRGGRAVVELLGEEFYIDKMGVRVT